MSKHRHEARGRVTQKLTRDGLVERNAATGAEEHIGKRSSDFDIRGEKSADHDLSQVGKSPAGKQSASRRNRTAYNQAGQQTHEAPPADISEAGQYMPRQDISAAAGSRAENGDDSPLRQERGIPGQHPSDGAAPPGKGRRYYRRFAEPQSVGGASITGEKPQPGESLADVADAPAESAPLKPQSGRESQFRTDSTGALRFSRDESAAQGKPKRPKHRHSKAVRPDAEMPHPGADDTRVIEPSVPPVSATPIAAAQQPALRFDKPGNLHFTDDAATEPVKPQKPKRPRPAPPSGDAGGPAQEINPAHVENAGVPETVPRTPQKEPDTALKQKKPGKLQFTEDETPPKVPPRGEVKQQKRYGEARKQADESVKNAETAKSKLPSKKKLRSKRILNEETGKAKTKLFFESEAKSQTEHLKGALPLRPVKAAGNSALAFGHRKMFQVERENVAAEAAHKGEMTAEGIVRSALRHRKLAPYRKVAKLERKSVKKSINLAYQKALAENPKLKSNVLSRAFQKRKIKKDYAKAAREAQKSAKRAMQTGSAVGNAAKALAGAVKRHPVAAAAVVLIGLLLFGLMSLVGAFGGMGSGTFGGILTASYLADDADIDSAELSYTEWETDLQMQIANAETSHPGYDEYRYGVADISHNPYELMAYLTVKHQNFAYSAIEADLRALFTEQYTLAFTPSTETRYADPTDANGDGDFEPYDWNVLAVTLTARSFTDIALSRLSGDEYAHYALLLQTKGSRQYIANPFGDLNWLSYVTSCYGYRIHPISGEKNCHKGVDIALPTGTPILSGQDGTVTFAGYSGDYGNAVVIEDDKGLVSKYAHCDTLNVTAGQTVKTGDIIAAVGNTGASTGAHLHLEILKDGRYLNPLYYCDSGSPNLAPAYGYAGAAPEPGTYAAMIAEAERYLGFPYVFGGSSPSTSFDCSGYVSWIINHSGWNVGRLGATGLFNICAPVSPADAKPGDLVFFHSTYSAPNPVTHVGLYAGTDAGGRPKMLHCGSPIQYTYIDTAYWQQHFFSFGRLPRIGG
jgi:murein DD-endopeptidase MepM/ murein hydrolase activator NlpD